MTTAERSKKETYHVGLRIPEPKFVYSAKTCTLKGHFVQHKQFRKPSHPNQLADWWTHDYVDNH
jgi:hypothetical protein